MPATELSARKKTRVQQLNAFIMQKKDLSAAQEGRQQLLADKGKADRSPEGVILWGWREGVRGGGRGRGREGERQRERG